MSVKLNKNFFRLSENYLFAETANRINEFKRKNPDKKLLNLGIGDVSLPLSASVLNALKLACGEQGRKESFRGYAPYGGYDFMKNAVINRYRRLGAELSEEEIFINDGAKSDIANLLTIFGKCSVLLPVPCYPAYIDVNIIKGNEINFLSADEQTFLPDFNKVKRQPYLIYICSPNNPAGVVYDKKLLQKIVDFALETGSVIIFDAAYSAFIRGEYPKSVFQAEGAAECAIEINSLSKSHGFTGLRLGWCIIKNELKIDGKRINSVWNRRLGASYNGAPYIIQRAGEAALSEKGEEESKAQTDYYLRNAGLVKAALESLDIKCFGGENSPYLWFKCPQNADGGEYFDFLLNEYGIVGTMGAGFGKEFEKYFRFSAFLSFDDAVEACNRLKNIPIKNI